MKKDKTIIRVNGNLRHITYLKLILNPVLRLLQFYTDKPYVIASIVQFNDSHDPHEIPEFIKYSFSKVQYKGNFGFIENFHNLKERLKKSENYI